MGYFYQSLRSTTCISIERKLKCFCVLVCEGCCIPAHSDYNDYYLITLFQDNKTSASQEPKLPIKSILKDPQHIKVHNYGSEVFTQWLYYASLMADRNNVYCIQCHIQIFISN